MLIVLLMMLVVVVEKQAVTNAFSPRMEERKKGSQMKRMSDTVYCSVLARSNTCVLGTLVYLVSQSASAERVFNQHKLAFANNAWRRLLGWRPTPKQKIECVLQF